MQILMGVNETIIRINNSKIYTENLVNFMQTQFSLYTQKQKSIIILYHNSEYHKRIYLMKWLYSMYVKISKVNMPNMKQLLINRIEKPIKIQFIDEIIKPKKTYSYDKYKEIPKKNLIDNELKIAMNILDVNIYENKKTIKMKYKNLLKRYHPDNVFNESQVKIDTYTQKFQEIQASYSIIMSNENHKWKNLN